MRFCLFTWQRCAGARESTNLWKLVLQCKFWKCNPLSGCVKWRSRVPENTVTPRLTLPVTFSVKYTCRSRRTTATVANYQIVFALMTVVRLSKLHPTFVAAPLWSARTYGCACLCHHVIRFYTVIVYVPHIHLTLFPFFFCGNTRM